MKKRTSFEEIIVFLTVMSVSFLLIWILAKGGSFLIDVIFNPKKKGIVTCFEPGCDNTFVFNGEDIYCEEHLPAHTRSKEKKKKTSVTPKATPVPTKSPSSNYKPSKKSNTSKKRSEEMPDCDDYDSYEDFMDDWDGAMPDGSDASDYWDDW